MLHNTCVCVCVCVCVQGGWTPVGGAVVWQRIVKILGDINKIPDTNMHLLAFDTLLSVWRHLVEVRRERRERL